MASMTALSIVPARVNPVAISPQERRLSLDGVWRFRLDPDDRGLPERWYAHPEVLSEEVRVPGCWQGQGLGGDGEEMTQDFRLRARTFRATYTGTGWYGTTLAALEEWAGSRLWLNFGGAHPSAQVWLNGEPVGENDLPYVPFALEITDLVRPGVQNDLVVRIHEYNRPLGFSYNWQGHWSGLYRSVELTATGPACLERLWLWPQPDREVLTVRAQVAGFRVGQASSLSCLVLRLSLSDAHGSAPLAAELPVSGAQAAADLPVPSPRLWSPDTPNLYRVDATLCAGETVLDARSERVGFVSMATEGKHFLINGEPYYMRGSGDFLANPETGSPDTDRERWRRKLQVLRDYGYNHVRCQSYAPSPEYLDAADEVGLLVQSELGVLGAWGGHSEWHIYPWPQPTPDNREVLQRQWDLVVERDVNHPSANLYCMSNEWPANMPYPRIAWDCYHRTKAIKPTAFVIWTDGTYREDLPGDFVNAEAAVDAECDLPVIQHEFRWWSALPDVRIMPKYNGAIRPWGAGIALEAAARHGISHILPQGAATSQRLQFLEAKAKMEACRRDNPTLAGISHFSFTDFNPSPQGIVDEFYERKYADADTWRQTNGDTVVLCSLGFDDRVLGAGEALRCRFFVSDFSHPPLAAPELEWKLAASDSVLDGGRTTYEHQPYCTCPAGEIETAILALDRPLAARLEATLREGEREVTNRWDLWLLPEPPPLAGAVAVYGEPRHTWLRSVERLPAATARDLQSGQVRLALSERLDETLADFVAAGGRTLLAAGEGLVRPFQPKLGMPNQYFFTPPANYPTYEDGQDGTIILPHPMLGDFPQEGFADLQFFRLIDGYPPLDLEPLGLTGGDPVIRVIHSYPVGRPLGYLVEGRWGQGSLLLCALGLDQCRLEARYLLAQICAYGLSEASQPSLELTEEAVAMLIRETSLP
jgi:hypothetical protein